MSKKELRFSLTAKDFTWQTFRAGGKGGQNQNKRDTGVRCIHPPSGAVGTARDERSQLQNKRLAFERCTADPKFKLWLKMQAGMRDQIEVAVNEAMHERNLRVEVHDEKGRWVEVDPDQLT